MSLKSLKVYAYETRDEVSEEHVIEVLNEYYDVKHRSHKVVKTSDSNYQLHVYVSAEGDFTTYVIFKGKPVAVIYFDNLLDRRRLYKPHVMVAKEFRNQGLAKLVYRWFLNSGNILVTESHSEDAKRLWDSLDREFKSGYWLSENDIFVRDLPKDLLSSWTYRALIGKGSVVKI